MTDLLPCPFCGSDDVTQVYVRVADDAKWWHCRCNACKAASEYKPDPTEAIAAWNMRAPPATEAGDALVKRLRATHAKPAVIGEGITTPKRESLVAVTQVYRNPDGPEAADALEAQARQIAYGHADNKRLREALIRLRDCDWVISLPDRMDAVRDIARRALEGSSQ